MRKIIDGLLFDTDKAEVVAEFEFGAYNNFDYYDETLYKTAGGRWFLAGSGGPRSPYARSDGHETSGSSELTVMSEDQAYDWCVEHAKVDVVIKNFPDRVAAA